MESILKTIDGVKSANYHLNKFLSAFAWSSLSTRIISTESTAWWSVSCAVLSYLQGKHCLVICLLCGALLSSREALPGDLSLVWCSPISKGSTAWWSVSCVVLSYLQGKHCLVICLLCGALLSPREALPGDLYLVLCSPIFNESTAWWSVSCAVLSYLQGKHCLVICLLCGALLSSREALPGDLSLVRCSPIFKKSTAWWSVSCAVLSYLQGKHCLVICLLCGALLSPREALPGDLSLVWCSLISKGSTAWWSVSCVVLSYLQGKHCLVICILCCALLSSRKALPGDQSLVRCSPIFKGSTAWWSVSCAVLSYLQGKHCLVICLLCGALLSSRKVLPGDLSLVRCSPIFKGSTAWWSVSCAVLSYLQGKHCLVICLLCGALLSSREALPGDLSLVRCSPVFKGSTAWWLVSCAVLSYLQGKHYLVLLTKLLTTNYTFLLLNL